MSNNDSTHAAVSNQVLHGDCVQVLQSLPGESIDTVITDPPYLVGYRDRSGRSIANDNNASVLDAFSDIYRVLKPNSLCVCFYGWNRVDAFFRAWTQAGFQPVGHLVWAKSYASRVGFLEARHEQAYLLAKGRPQRPEAPCPTCSRGSTAATSRIRPRRPSASSGRWLNPSVLPAASCSTRSRDRAAR